jgi:hypothetical protein
MITPYRTRPTLARGVFLFTCIALVAISPAGYCRKKAAEPPQPPSPEVRKVVDQIVAGEKQFAANLKRYSPRVETYLQYTRADVELGDRVVDDGYFMGRLSLSARPKELSFTPESTGAVWRGRLEILGTPFLFTPNHFLDRIAATAVFDTQDFDAQHYSFDPVGWEYLGDIRCLALDVKPIGGKVRPGAFQGRIWVEDRNYAIVRLNGGRVNPLGYKSYVHFETWRENLRPGEWYPVYVYSEDKDVSGKVRMKSTTRFWGYDLSAPHQQDTEWTKILVESPAPVHDASDAGADMAPVEGKRQLELQAERNVLERLEKARLVAPAGPVDKVLETVLNNLVVTNHLDNLPPLHCRVMLTAPFESFSLRYTIVVSRGLVDVLPDEASLAMVLAHELAHVALGHKVDTMYSFNDRLFVSDEDALAALDLERTRQEEAAADAKALEFLRNSPYKDKLANAGLFLRAAVAAAPVMPHLFGPHLGNRFISGRDTIRLATLMAGAPELKPKQMDQVAALPLSSRVQVSAWDGSISFPNRKTVALIDASEKMPFRLAPLYPRLVRYEDANNPNAATRPGQ